MSLDLTIKTNKLIRHVSTGVYIREDGCTKELKTIDDVKKHFPNKDISHICEQVYYDDELWTKNITHNLSEMAEHVIINDQINLCDLLWKPKDNGFDIVTQIYIDYISNALRILKSKKKELEKFNPKNNWGNYDLLLDFVNEYMDVLNTLDLKNEIYFIDSSV